MNNSAKNQSVGVVKSVLMAYLVLALHLVLVAALGILVLFFRGVVQYMALIFLSGVVLIGVSAYLFYRRMRAEGKNLRQMMQAPMLAGRSVEVSLLGGLATMRLGKTEKAQPALTDRQAPAARQLEDLDTARVRELAELGRLLEKDMITRDEFNRAKQRLLKL